MYIDNMFQSIIIFKYLVKIFLQNYYFSIFESSEKSFSLNVFNKSIFCRKIRLFISGYKLFEEIC